MNIDVKQVLEDAKTFMLIGINENYKERLYEAYLVLKKSNIKTYEEFETSSLGIGAFTYNQITIFDRIKDEKYYAALSSHVIEIKGLSNLPNDYGDRLASWGTIGDTPYRETLIKNGCIEDNFNFKAKKM